MSRDAASGALPALTIKEVARRSGLSDHTLRYYEKIGLIPPVPRTSSGHRQYSSEMANAIELLACLRTSGLTIAEMRTYLKDGGLDPATAAEQKALFETRRKEIIRQIQRLRLRQKYLEDKIAYWDALARDDVQAAERFLDAHAKLSKE